MSLPPGRPKEGDVPLGGTARSAREQICLPPGPGLDVGQRLVATGSQRISVKTELAMKHSSCAR